MHKAIEWVKEHKLLTAGLVIGVVVLYYLYKNHASASSSSASVSPDPNAALLAALQSAGSNGGSGVSSLGPIGGGSVISQPSAGSNIPNPSGSGVPTSSVPPVYTSPAPIDLPTTAATVPSYYSPVATQPGSIADQQSPSTPTPDLTGAVPNYAAIGPVNTSGVFGTVGAIVKQWAQILSPNNPFITNNPSLAQGAADQVNIAVQQFCSNPFNVNDPSCSASNLAAATAAANAVQSNLPTQLQAAAASGQTTPVMYADQVPGAGQVTPTPTPQAPTTSGGSVFDFSAPVTRQLPSRLPIQTPVLNPQPVSIAPATSPVTTLRGALPRRALFGEVGSGAA